MEQATLGFPHSITTMGEIMSAKRRNDVRRAPTSWRGLGVAIACK
jgi:hypothetical protein